MQVDRPALRYRQARGLPHSRPTGKQKVPCHGHKKTAIKKEEGGVSAVGFGLSNPTGDFAPIRLCYRL